MEFFEMHNNTSYLLLNLSSLISIIVELEYVIFCDRVESLTG